MTCFACVQTSAAAPDPTKHVNYVQGMVLGVDDFTQEFTYLAQRDQWAARDLAGYGTVWGLAVATRDGGLARGQEVVVSPGVAVNPRGQLIRVAPAQCASLDEWLKPRGRDIVARQIPTANPNLFELPLWLALSYRTCLTDPVPIAGEPCRSEDNSTAPSRAADDFLLELLFDPPPQQEEDAVLALVQWLRAHLVVVPGSTPALSVVQFLDDIRAAARAAQQAESSPPVTSPPGAPVYLLDSSPVTPLVVPPELVSDYLRGVARLWATELRPLWRPNWLGQKHGCAGSDLIVSPEEGNRVLLAQLTLTIGPRDPNSAVWVVQGPVAIDEGARPILLDIRLLQERLIAQPGAGGIGAGGPAVVAAGIINGNGKSSSLVALNGLKVASSANVAGATNLVLTFDGYVQPPASGGPQYLLKALPWSSIPNLSLTFGGFQAGGLTLSVSKAGAPLSADELKDLQLMVEVTQVG